MKKNSRPFQITFSTALLILLAGCSESQLPISQDVKPAVSSESGNCERFDENRTALFGDLHIHTSYSFDAAANSTGATPEDAHRYARGESIPIFPI